MTATFIGFGSPVVGNTVVLTDVELVKRDLYNCFYTKKGERVMDVSYGFIGWDLIFELDSPGTLQALEADARRIVQLEPRVQEISITVSKIEYGYVVAISLNFLILDTVDELKMVFDQRSIDRQNTAST